jgi:ketosteroid isomerase-like protein
MVATANQELVERFWQAMSRNDWTAAGRLLHEDYLLHWPQSGERIRGRGNFVAVNANYPAAGPWRFTVHRLVADEHCVASDVTVTDGAISSRAVSFFEMRDGLIWRVIEFWPDPFPPAAWRAAWTDRAGSSSATS